LGSYILVVAPVGVKFGMEEGTFKIGLWVNLIPAGLCCAQCCR